MSLIKSFLLWGAVASLAACATTPDVMRYQPKGAALDFARVWPATPETPRYRFAGELTGQDNFGPSEQNQPGTGEKILRWIVGLGARLGGSRRDLVRPQSGMVDEQGRIYVTDAGRSAVFVFDEALGKMYIWEDAGDFANFDSPVSIAPGRPGELLVTDSALSKVVRLDMEGNVLGSFGDDVLERPTGLAHDLRTGEVFVADTPAHDIKVFDELGRMLRSIGERGEAPGQFNAPTHLALVNGRLDVADTLNARVQILDTGGSEPDIFLYWDNSDGGTGSSAWSNVVPLGSGAAGT